MILILDNLRSAHNVGSLFRTADGAGASHIFLVGITPKPAKPDQLYLTSAEKTLQKTALGAEGSVHWSTVKTLAPLIRKLKAASTEVLALEEGEALPSIDYRAWQPKAGMKEVALVVGNEVEGLHPKTLSLADAIIHLPMRGAKNSLNVSIAAGIALYHLSDTIERLKATECKPKKNGKK
ncbi:MAG: TrmH family RNA methyltransferase [Undibacterium sp.]